MRVIRNSNTAPLRFSGTPINALDYRPYGISVIWSPPKADFYGSGQQDVLGIIPFDAGGVAVLHFTGGVFVASQAADTSILSVIDNGDYNNDGCKDILTFSELVLSDCNGAVGAGFTFGADQAVAGLDWDGGGQHAVVVNHGGMLGIYKVQGNSLSNLIMTSIPYRSGSFYATLENPIGDGSDGLLVINNSSTAAPLQYYLHNGNGQPADLLSKVADGYGNSASPTYVSIAENNYSRIYNAAFPDPPTYPDKYYTGPLYVVDQVAYSDPSSAAGTYQETFWYYDAWMNLQGRGFGGFKQMGRHDLRTGLWDTLGFAGAFPVSGVFAFDLLSRDQAGTQIIRESFANVVNPALDSTLNNQRYFVYYNQTTTRVYEVGGTKDGQPIRTLANSYAYDNFGS